MTARRPLPQGIRLHRGKYQVRFYGSDGREHAKSFARLTDAKRFKAEMEVDRHRGVWTDPRSAKIHFEDWASKYLQQKLSIRPRTAEKYESSVRNHLLPAFGRTPLGVITRDDVQTWVADMQRQGLAPETIRGHYDLLAAMLKRAADDGVIGKTPARNAELPRVVRTEQRYLTESQVEVLVAEVPDRYKALVYSAAYLGLRWQELAGLRRELVDLRPGKLATVRVVTTIERARGRYRAVEYGKSTAARRTLKTPAFLRDVLAWHLGAFESDEWVFPAAEGGFLRYDNVRVRVWTPAVARAGLEPLTFHQLRHTAAAFMIDDGADPLQVKRRMGHEDIRTTFNLYGHLFDDREDELVAALDRRHDSARNPDTDQKRTGTGNEVVALDDKRAKTSL